MSAFNYPNLMEKDGIVLNMASVAAPLGLSARFSCSTARSAVLGVTLSIAKGHLSYNIRSNCVSPGRVHTPFVDRPLKENSPGREKEMFDKPSKDTAHRKNGKT